jgi:hypothetical protein
MACWTNVAHNSIQSSLEMFLEEEKYLHAEPFATTQI